MSKRIMAFLLAAAMAVSMAACGNANAPAESKPAETPAATTPTTTEKPKEELNLNPEAIESGSKGILDLNIEEILTTAEIEAMKAEPIYGQTINYFYDSGNCTSTPYLAGVLGLYDSLGMKVESFKGTSIKEALGTNACQYGVSHIASMLVPITNDVNYSFVSGVHVGCKSLYVLADSGINSTADLKGKSVAVPNGIGNSDYNITARMFDRDGINPMTEVTLTPVETSACIAAMQNGEIGAALLSDTYAYKMVADGTLKCIRSITWDADFQTDPCCILAMNNDFIKENPIHAKLAVYCVKVANVWAGQNPEEAVQLLIDENFISGDFDMNLELWNTLQFGACTDEFTKKSLTQIVDDYIRLGLITSSKSVEETMAKAWNPLAPEADEIVLDAKEEITSDAVSLTVSALSAAEIEAMKAEPMYDDTIIYWYGGGNCTSAPYIAEVLGLYEQYGIKSEVLSGAAIKESLGTNAAQIGVSHIASLLVPITNGVNYSFVAGAHAGCQSLFVLADSPYQTTADLIGKKISVPNGIGNSSYNITARWLDADGIDPLKDVEMIQVETDACIASMESGEIAAVCTGDTWGYDMVKSGKLRVIRSLLDPDFAQEPCCVIAMNNEFIKENPNMAKAMTECIKIAGDWMRQNPEEAVQILLDANQLSGAFEKNLELWNTLQFGLTDEATGAALEQIIDDYIRLGLIPEGNMTQEEMLAAAWNPQLSDSNLGYETYAIDGSWWN